MQELSELGAAGVQMSRHGYVMARMPANTCKTRMPMVAFSRATWIRRRTAPAKTLNPSFIASTMTASSSSRLSPA